MKRFTGKVAIITGASRGMGYACSLSFLEEGASVALVDVREDVLEKALVKLQPKGKKAIAIECNVSKYNDVQDAVGKVIERFGTIDILVNNAGVLRTTTPLEKIEENE